MAITLEGRPSSTNPLRIFHYSLGSIERKQSQLKTDLSPGNVPSSEHNENPSLTRIELFDWLPRRIIESLFLLFISYFV